jgi:zinc finger protein
MCRKGGAMKTSTLDVPHFRDCIILEFSCAACYFKSSELKSGGGVSASGGRWTLRVTGPSDLGRDLLKSNTARVSIPEFQFEMGSGSLGGMYTTVEGLLSKIHGKLSNLKNGGGKRSHAFAFGDSGDGDIGRQTRFAQFLATLDSCRKGVLFPWTLVVEDPMDASFIYSAARDGMGVGLDDGGSESSDASKKKRRDFDDGVLKRETYTRSPEENAEFGIEDMECTGYARCPDCGEWAEECTCSDDGYGGKSNAYPKAAWTHDVDVTCWDFEKALLESLSTASMEKPAESGSGDNDY